MDSHSLARSLFVLLPLLYAGCAERDYTVRYSTPGSGEPIVTAPEGTTPYILVPASAAPATRTTATPSTTAPVTKTFTVVPTADPIPSNTLKRIMPTDSVVVASNLNEPAINSDKKDDDDGKEKADNKNGDKDKEKANEPDPWYSIHGQGTVVTQGNGPFRSPYQGLNSLQSASTYHTTETATLFLDAKVWTGGEIIFNPEIAGGSGLSGTTGMAGFPNGEATRVGLVAPTPYVARLYFQQTFGLGGEQEDIPDGPNTIQGKMDFNRVTVRIGKMAATDQFDDNDYSHDPRGQFLNWALMYNGAWDYPANVRGYTYGGTIEWNNKYWAVRYGIWAEPATANGAPIDPHFLKAHGQAVEFEERWWINNRPGNLRFMAYVNNANMGKYADAIQQMPVNPDITTVRSYRAKYGFGISYDEELSDDVGIFARLGWNDGNSESWAFTEIDRTFSVGMRLKGNSWQRGQDTVGLAFLINGLSQNHRDYLAAGGYGFIVGDGRLSYAPEEIVEMYYNWQMRKGINATLDFQGVNDPGYNRDRGPVAIMGIRMHFEY